MLAVMMTRLAVLGNGNMGWNVLLGALDAKVLEPDEVVVVESNPVRADLAAARGIRIVNAHEALEAEHLFLAVKPQSFQALAREMGPLSARRIVISVMAGIRSTSIRKALGELAAVVRVMPNTPARLRAGVSAICAGDGAQPEDLAFPHQLMSSVGSVVEVTENHMYAVTATSGSGPAFVLRMAEVMEAAAIKEGLDHKVARALVQKTILGAGRLMLETGEEPSELREAVTSKGGTTAAGLDAMRAHGFDEAVTAAIRAATERGLELDREHG
jgi:pyrroline-5-carboxylate reductase